jgi:hypothetical protein
MVMIEGSYHVTMCDLVDASKVVWCIDRDRRRKEDEHQQPKRHTDGQEPPVPADRVPW